MSYMGGSNDTAIKQREQREHYLLSTFTLEGLGACTYLSEFDQYMFDHYFCQEHASVEEYYATISEGRYTRVPQLRRAAMRLEARARAAEQEQDNEQDKEQDKVKYEYKDVVEGEEEGDGAGEGVNGDNEEKEEREEEELWGGVVRKSDVPLLILQPLDDPLHQGRVRAHLNVPCLTANPHTIYMETAYGNHFGFYQGVLDSEGQTYPGKAAAAFFSNF